MSWPFLGVHKYDVEKEMELIRKFPIVDHHPVIVFVVVVYFWYHSFFESFNFICLINIILIVDIVVVHCIVVPMIACILVHLVTSKRKLMLRGEDVVSLRIGPSGYLCKCLFVISLFIMLLDYVVGVIFLYGLINLVN